MFYSKLKIALHNGLVNTQASRVRVNRFSKGERFDQGGSWWERGTKPKDFVGLQKSLGSPGWHSCAEL